MITAVDTNVLIDVVTQNERAIDALAQAASQGQLIICEIVFTEMCAGMPLKDMNHFCSDFDIKLVRSSAEALGLAGQLWREYKDHSKQMKGRVLADFIVASHAIKHADCLMTTDRGFYREYFKNLKLLNIP